jgi:hypothetical protein
VIPNLCLWLTPKGKGGDAGRKARRRGVPRPPWRILAIRVSRAAPPYLKPPPSPGGRPNPSCLRGETVPLSATNPPEEREK